MADQTVLNHLHQDKISVRHETNAIELTQVLADTIQQAQTQVAD